LEFSSPFPVTFGPSVRCLSTPSSPDLCLSLCILRPHNLNPPPGQPFTPPHGPVLYGVLTWNFRFNSPVLFQAPFPSMACFVQVSKSFFSVVSPAFTPLRFPARFSHVLVTPIVFSRFLCSHTLIFLLSYARPTFWVPMRFPHSFYPRSNCLFVLFFPPTVSTTLGP